MFNGNNSKVISLVSLRYFTSVKTMLYEFQGVPLLERLVIPQSVTTFRSVSVIRSCPKLKYIVFLPTQMIAAAGGNSLLWTNDCPVYVPDDLVSSYKTAQYWNQYASRFKPLSTLVDW